MDLWGIYRYQLSSLFFSSRFKQDNDFPRFRASFDLHLHLHLLCLKCFSVRRNLVIHCSSSSSSPCSGVFLSLSRWIHLSSRFWWNSEPLPMLSCPTTSHWLSFLVLFWSYYWLGCFSHFWILFTKQDSKPPSYRFSWLRLSRIFVFAAEVVNLILLEMWWWYWLFDCGCGNRLIPGVKRRIDSEKQKVGFRVYGIVFSLNDMKLHLWVGFML